MGFVRPAKYFAGRRFFSVKTLDKMFIVYIMYIYT